jgi:hypothetical protein
MVESLFAMAVSLLEMARTSAFGMAELPFAMVESLFAMAVSLFGMVGSPFEAAVLA